MYIIISYDIKSDRRRAKLHKALKDYGTWVQYSVFECDLKKREFLKLRHRLKKLFSDEEEDSLRFYHVCDTCQGGIERIGGIVPPDFETVVVRKGATHGTTD